MFRLLNQLLKDQRGMILSSEVVLVGTILVLGSIVGLAAVSHAVTNELNDVANAYNSFSGFQSDAAGPYHTPDSGGGYSITDNPGVPEVAGY